MSDLLKTSPTVIFKLVSGDTIIAIMGETFVTKFADDLPGEIRIRVRYPMSLVPIDARNFLMFKWPSFRRESSVQIPVMHIVTTAEADDIISVKYMEQVALELQRKFVVADMSGIVVNDPNAQIPIPMKAPDADAELILDNEDEPNDESEPPAEESHTDDDPVATATKDKKKKEIIH